MKILHVCLASVFTEGMTYQDNLLTDQNCADGHEVCIVADCSVYSKTSIVQVPVEDRVLASGSRLVRLKLVPLLPPMLTHKLRIAPGLGRIIEQFGPDVILYHGVVGVGLLTVGRYKRRHPKVKLYIDSHEDFHNSGRNLISRWVQYRLITRALLAYVRPVTEKILYISSESADFLRAMYGLRDEEMEFFPLGGHPLPPAERQVRRERARKELGLGDGDIAFVHTGKLDQLKRSNDLIRAFKRVPSAHARLLVVGSIPDDDPLGLRQAMQGDDRIKFVGWVNNTRLVDILCACDCYAQPGGQSATLQVALCCGMPAIARSYPSHRPYIDGNGFYADNEEELVKAMSAVVADPSRLEAMSRRSYEIAETVLDYRILAQRLYR